MSDETKTEPTYDTAQAKAETSALLTEAATKATEEARANAPADDGASEREESAKAQPRDPNGKFKALARKEHRAKKRQEERERDLSAREQRAAVSEQDRKDLEELRAIRAAAAESPYEVAKKLGIDVNRLTDQILTEGKPEAELAKLRADIDRDRKQREDRETQAQHAARVAALRGEEERFCQEASADEYPALDGANASTLLQEAYAVGKEITEVLASQGARRHATNKEILAELNARHAARLEKVAAKMGYAKSGAPAKHGARTVTARDSQERGERQNNSALDRPLSGTERAAEIARMLRAAGMNSGRA